MNKRCLLIIMVIGFLAVSIPLISQTTYTLSITVTGRMNFWCNDFIELNPPNRLIYTSSDYEYDAGTSVTLRIVQGLTPRTTYPPCENMESIRINGSRSPLTLIMDEDKEVLIEYLQYWCPPTPTPVSSAFSLNLNVVDAEASEENLDTAQFIIEEELYDPTINGWIEVLYSTSGSAINGTDYRELSNVVWVLLGEDTGSTTPPPGADQNIITIIPIDDTKVENTETVTITLRYYSGVSATITIADNEEIPEYTPGDVNYDSVIDIIDALLITQLYVGLDPPTFTAHPIAGDINCDGFVDIVDALLIAQYYVGIIHELLCY